MTYYQFLLINENEYDVNEKLTFKVSYNEGEISKDYIEVIVKSSNEKDRVYAYFSGSSEDRKDADILSYENSDEVTMYISKKLTVQGANNFFYFTVRCFVNPKCSVTIQTTEMDHISIGRSQEYTYLTQEKTKTNTVKIPRSKRYEEQGFITLWATGHPDIEMDVRYYKNEERLDNVPEIIPVFHYNGKIVKIDESLYPNIDDGADYYFVMEVKSPALSLVSIGSQDNYYDQEKNPKPIMLQTNGKEKHGLLTKDYPEECYKPDIPKEKIDFDSMWAMHVIDLKKSLNVNYYNVTNGTKILNKEEIVEDGMSMMLISIHDTLICFNTNKTLDEFDYVEYTFQPILKKEVTNYPSVYSPQVKGIPYSRFLHSDEYDYFVSLPTDNFKTEYRMKLNVLFGFPKLYIVKCNTFPDCKFNPNNNETEMIAPHNINGMYSYSFFKKELNPKFIDSEQYVLFAFCPKDKDSTINLDCQFEINFFTEKDTLYLRNNKKYYNTIMKDGENTFAINTMNLDQNCKQIFVNFFTFSGDISIKKGKDNYKERSFKAANKQYFVLNLPEGETHPEHVIYKVKGILDSHFVVDYKFICSEDDKFEMKGDTGISYLETIEQKFLNGKTIKLNNRRVVEEIPFMANFWSLNCEVAVIRQKNDGEDLVLIPTYNHIAQEVITKEDTSYYEGYYSYTLLITKMENTTQFENNWCMVYVSAYEINEIQSNEFYSKNPVVQSFRGNDFKINNILYKQRQLLISEGQNNQIILNSKMPSIQYIYPHMNRKGWVSVYVVSEHETKFEMQIIINNNLYKKFNVGQSRYFVIREATLNKEEFCPYNPKRPSQPCNIVIQFTLDPMFYNDEPMLSFRIKSKEEVPAYVRKSMLRQDLIVGDYYQYYYTDVGLNEEGHVTVNFDRGMGHAFARIVSKEADEGQGWMDKFILPTEENSQLQYNHFTKSIRYTNIDTSDCNKGCYLIILVKHGIVEEGFNYEYVSYPFSIYISASNTDSFDYTPEEITIVDVPMNEFVVGSASPLYLDFLEDYYGFYIPFEASEIIIEMESDGCTMVVNVDDHSNPPNIPDAYPQNAHFSFNEIGNHIYKISRKDILKITKTTSITNERLLLGIRPLYNLNVDSTIYSFRIKAVRQEEKDKGFSLIHLKSTQKTLCEIQGTNGNCYFLLPIDNPISLLNDFLFLAMPNPNVKYNYYASEIDKQYIIERNYEEIKENLPKESNCKWNSKKLSYGNYLYINIFDIDYSEEGTYIIINLEVSNPSAKSEEDILTIRFIHSFYALTDRVLPNPYSPQLFAVYYNPIDLIFYQEESNYIITITCVKGKGEIRWDSDEDEDRTYQLTEPGDRIILTSGWSEVYPLRFTSMEAPSEEGEPGFAFYIYYDKKTFEVNFDELKYGFYSEMDLKHEDFPLIFYSKIPDTDHLIDVSIKLTELNHDYNSNKNLKDSELTWEKNTLHNDYFIIQGMVVGESDVFAQRNEPILGPDTTKAFKGNMDASLNMLKIQFTPKIMKSYNITDEPNYLYVIVTKGPKNDEFYSGIKLEANVLPSRTDGYTPSMKDYNHGKLISDQDYSEYVLERIHKNYTHMRFEFSANSEDIEFTINEKKDADKYKNGTTFESATQIDGKVTIIIKYEDDSITSHYLTVFSKNANHTISNEKLSNFVFRYQLYEIQYETDMIPNYYLENDEVSYKYDNETNLLTLNLSQIIGLNDVIDIYYYIKLIPSSESVKNEKLNTISMVESKASFIEMYHFFSPGTEQTIVINNVVKDRNWNVVVVAEIIDFDRTEYFAYNVIENPTKYGKEEKKEESSDSNQTLIIVIIVVSSILLAAGCIFLFIYCKMKKNNQTLLQRVQNFNKDSNEPKTASLI